MTKIFVFGSNLGGRHGAGSAKEALLNHCAIYGQGIGLQGRSYAIPTKDEKLRVLPLEEIKKHVDQFIEFAKANPDKEFTVVKIGCGLAAISEDIMKAMFKDAPQNCNLPEGWRSNDTRRID